ncbi:MAG: DUF1080 domain-containing protein, partial [Arenibacter sp.]
MKKLIFSALIAVMVMGCKEKTDKKDMDVDSDPNPMANSDEMAPEVIEEGEWQVLFDGTNFDAW